MASPDSVRLISETVPMVTVAPSGCRSQQDLSPIAEEDPALPLAASVIVQENQPPSVLSCEDVSCDSSEERFTEMAASCELPPTAHYPLINGSIVWINKPSVVCCSARIDPLSMPCELQQFQVSHSEYCEVVDMLRRDPKIRCATCLFHRIFQYGLLICLSLILWTAGTLGWYHNGHRSNLGVGLFFIIAWFFFITGLFVWKLIRSRMSSHSRRLNVHVNKLLLRRKVLLTVMDYEYLTCSCDILTVAFLYFDPEPCVSHLVRMFDKPEILAKAKFSKKLTGIISKISRKAPADSSSAALLSSTSAPPAAPVEAGATASDPTLSAVEVPIAAAAAADLTGLPASQKKALARFLLLSYSSLYCNWLLRHKLPKPKEQRHTQTNIPCICQLAETLNFGQECLTTDDVV